MGLFLCVLSYALATVFLPDIDLSQNIVMD